MDHSRAISVLLSTTILMAVISPISGQVSTSCTTALLTSFTPCFNYLTGSTNGGGSPTASCCKSLASLIATSTDCACLILTGNVPFGLPINRTLAISLPRMCKSTTPSVPLQCRGTATPLPGPGPLAYGPSLPPLPPMPPMPSTSLSPSSPSTLSPSSSTLEPETPSVNQGQRPLVLPSSASKHFSFYSVSATAALLAFIAMIGI
ncbi:non-specific lipid transfer protein GPI-anchored 20 [Typha angustifolia]|uniref:non-specific lipid transfer protein GPI-anchored 20 n=1 Tax=Typha angustifolia TaxID=59011 RepID=UPI003C2E9B29